MRPVGMQQRLKASPRPAWTRIVSAKLLFERLVAVDDLRTSLYTALAWEAAAALVHRLKSAARSSH
jgi:hypothetical protein